MKTIGLIGGMSWESSIEYYRIINQKVREKLGGTHSAKCVMVSVDFAEIEILQHEGRWQEATQMLIDAAIHLEAAGADFIVLCTNTMHKMAEEIQKNTSIPFLHIADATAQKVSSSGISTIGLLGTRFTMEEDFYKGRLLRNFNLTVVVPDENDRKMIHHVIYDELVKGVIRPESKREFLKVIEKLITVGAYGVILGCTEIGLLVKEGDCRVPVFDTTRIHAEAAVAFALE
jgi:aspartate racemase